MCSCVLCLLSEGRLVLIGDHKQLPPCVASPVARDNGLQCSLLERFAQGVGSEVIMLQEQFRMHPSICNFPSHEFYNDDLLSAVTCKIRERLWGFPAWLSGQSCFVHVVGKEERNMGSIQNVEEARVAVSCVKWFIDHGLPCKDIGVVTLYNAQRLLILQLLSEAFLEVEVANIDAYQ